MVYTMIARIKNKGDSTLDTEYALVDSNYRINQIGGLKLFEAIRENRVQVTNLGVKNGTLVSTNGAMDRYTTYEKGSGTLLVEPSAVILFRIEKDNRLCGYTIYGLNREIYDISVKDAAQLAKDGKIANGKVRHTEAGDIVSSITGNYPLKEIATEKVKKISSTVNVSYVSKVRTKLEDKTVTVDFSGYTIECADVMELQKVMKVVREDNEKLVAQLKHIYSANKVDKEEIDRQCSALKIVQLSPSVYSVNTHFELAKKFVQKQKESNTEAKVNTEGMIMLGASYINDTHIEECISALHMNDLLRVAFIAEGSQKSRDLMATHRANIIKWLEEEK